MSKKVKFFIAVLCGIILCVTYLLRQTEGVYYKSYSPDGQYSKHASRDTYFNFDFPFVKFGDAGGRVHLYDELENKFVGSASLDMISNIDEMDWNENDLTQRGHFSIELPRSINKKMIAAYRKTTPVKRSWKLFIEGKQYQIDKKANRLTVSNAEGEILLENIQFISQIYNGIQVINNKTEIEYYNADLHKLAHVPDQDSINELCGNVTTYGLKIEDTEKYFVIKKAVGFTNYNFTNYIAIDSVSKTKVKDLYFLNKKRVLEYDENMLKSELVIIDYGTYFGVLEDTYGIQYFDAVTPTEADIKVERNGLYGYYNISGTKYVTLGPFKSNLAEFKDADNKTGYIDLNGNEYYIY